MKPKPAGVSDLQRDQVFVQCNGVAVTLAELETIVRHAPVSGYADIEIGDPDLGLLRTGRADAVRLYDHKTRISHHLAAPDLSELGAILKALGAVK